MEKRVLVLTTEEHQKLLTVINEVKGEIFAYGLERHKEIESGGPGEAVNKNSGVADIEIRIACAIGRLAELEDKRARTIISDEKCNGVNIGDIVTILEDGEESICCLSFEKQPTGEISIDCPFGMAIKGKNIGEICQYQACGITYSVKIIDIKKPSELSPIEPKRAR